MNLRKSVASAPDLVATITYVKVEIGYACLPALFGGLTIFSCERFVTLAGSLETAAVTLRIPGSVNVPEELRIAAIVNLFVIEYAAST